MQEQKPNATVLAILALLLGAAFTGNSVQAQPWLDPNWAYRMPVTVSNSAGPNNLSDYPVRIDLNSGNFDFSYAKPNGGDIRFTSSDGVTPLDFWIEDYNSLGQTAIIWAEVPSIVASDSVDIFMYFGNSAAGTVADGDETFDLFDDFSASATGIFGNWQRVVVDNGFDGAHNVVVDDVDGDARPDLVADAYRANEVAWFRQPSDAINGTWVKYIIDDNLPNVHDSQIGDMDGDGRDDIVSVSLSENWQDYNQGNGSLVWYQKPVDPVAAGATGWTPKQPCPSATGDGGAAVYNDKLYVFGGHYLGVTDPRAESYAYDPNTDSWTRLQDMPTARWGQVGVEFDGNIHVFAGMINSTATGVHEIYDPETDTWQSSSDGNPLDIPQYAASGAVHPDVIYFPQGKDGYKYWMAYTPYPPQSMENPSVLRSKDGIHWTDMGINNPVVPQGTPGSWNAGENADPDFLYVADYDKWFMVWAGQDANVSEAIALAYSSDGVNWTQYDGVPVNGNAHPAIVSGEDANGQPWEVDGSGVSKLQCPTLFYEDSTFYLYYVDEVAGNNNGRAGFATFSWNNTTDDIENFQRYAGNPTITIGCGHLDLSWNPSDELYHMYVVKGSSLVLLTSTDLISWTNTGEVLERGESGQWDSSYIYRSCPVVDSNGRIVFFDDKIRIYYSATGTTTYRIGIADISETEEPNRFEGTGVTPVPAELANQGLMAIKYEDRIHLFYKQYHFEYDPVTDIYTPKADVPTPRTWTTCALVDDKIYLIGGYSYGSPGGATNVNERYDPNTNSWTTLTPMPASKYGVTRDNPVIDGIIYVTHGLDGGFHTDNYAYDPSTDTWMQKSSGYNPRDGVECGVINNKLYVSRGRDDYINGGTGTSYLEEYDPAADVPMAWTKTVISASGSTGLLGARSLGLGDLDSDGDLDIAVAVDAQTYQSTGRLSWYQNPGDSNALDPNLWNEYLIDQTQGCGADAQISDMDNDGNPDIVYAGNTGSPANLFVYFAPDDPCAVGSWVRVALAGNTYHVHIVDFDGDGDLDILRASALSDLVSWLENPYPANVRDAANWTEYIIEQDSTIHVANRVSTADIDGDGDLDVGMDSDPSGSSGYFKWYRRPDDPRDVNSYEIYIIDSNPTYTAYAHDSYLADIDQDGDIDMAGVGANANTIMWWVNGETAAEIDPNKWVNGGAIVSGSAATINAPATYLRSKQQFLYSALRCKGKFEEYANYGYIGFNSGVLNVGADDATFVCFSNSTVKSITSSEHTWTWGYTANEGTDWRIWEVLWNPTETKFLVDDNLRQSHTTNIPSIQLTAQINSYSGSPTVKADWVLVRKYTVPEPTVSAGSIEPYSPAPVIYSTPVTQAVVDNLYSYDVDAAGFPAPTYALVTGPNDMSIDVNTGLIQWIPSVAQIGLNPVTVEANNIHGSDLQSFDVNVLPWIVPSIVSEPVTSATVGQLYVYDVNAAGIPAPSYSLDSAPEGMTIDANTGLIQWTAAESQLGSNPVTVRASNIGGADIQTFAIEVAGVAPLIMSEPPDTIWVGELFSYDVNATGIPAPSYALAASPSGMTIDVNTGLVLWTPEANQVGDNHVTVQATNSAGSDSQDFVVRVLERFDANNWSYRMKITIDNTAGPNGLANYPIRVELDANNFDFSKADANGADIRFTDSDGKSHIDHWVEEYNSVRQAATIWAEVPNIPALNSIDIYMYLGNPVASDQSDGEATFDFFDHFSSVSDSNLAGDWLRVVVDDNFDGSHNVIVDDVDSDGRPDLVVDAYRASEVVWYQQPSDPINDDWTKYIIDPYLPNAHDCHVGNIDDDGLNDVVALSLSENWQDFTQGNGSLAWYKKPADPTATWTKVTIASSGTDGLLGARAMGLGDIDSDGDLDIALAVDGRGYRGAGRLFWYQNPGDSNALDPNLWNEYLIDDTPGNGADAQVGDIDNDGNPDIVYAGNAGLQGTFVYFAPDDATVIANWVRVSVAGDVYHVHIVDFDEDGDLDILRASAYSQLVSWLENPYPADPRDPANWNEYIIEEDPTIYVANRVSAADIDGDGDLDIGMDSDPTGSTGYFKWYRRPDDPRDVNAYDIYVIDSNPAYTAYAHDSFPADIDNDGDIDMAGVGPNARTVMWWVNGETATGIDTNKWDSSGATVAGSVVTIDSPNTYIRSREDFLHKALRCKARFKVYDNRGYIGFNSGELTVGSNDAMFVCFSDPNVRSITSSQSVYNWGYSFNEGMDWRIWDILWQQGWAEFYVDEVLRQRHTSNVPSVPLAVQINSSTGSPTVQADWILVRNYFWPEPLITTGPVEPYSNAAVITSVPVTEAVVTQPYSYDVEATGNPAPAYSLLAAPAGMTIDVNTGLIQWIPQVAQFGANPVTVEANNIHGSDSQSFDVNVLAVSPVITSVPITTAMIDQLYTYDVNADGIPAPTYSLISGPSGMAIDSNTGQIGWTPSESQYGTNAVTVQASNLGGTDTQNFSVQVSGVAPVITSSPVTSAIVGQLYSYDANATGLPSPIFALLSFPAGMALNSATGLVLWTPTAAQIGSNLIIICALNIVGYDLQPFTIDVEGIPPVITSSPVDTAVVGELYRYDVDADGVPEPIYVLLDGPDGMTIDPNTGLIGWTPVSANDVNVTVEANNDAGFNTQSFTVNVIVLPKDDFNDNRRGAIWRSLAEPYEDTRLIEDYNQLNLLASSDSNHSAAFYASNGWFFDENEDFHAQVDARYTGLSQPDGWVGLIVDDGIDYAAVSIGCKDGQPYVCYEAVTETSTLTERISRQCSDVTLHIWYDADTNELQLGAVGFGCTDPDFAGAPRTLLCEWNDAVQLFVGGGSNGAALTGGQAYLDGFKVTKAQLIDWPPATDVDGDGFVDYMDLEIICENWLAAIGEEQLVDFIFDGRIDFKDFAELALFWLQPDPITDVAPPPSGDGIVDALDLTLFAGYWLAEPDTATSVSGDINQDGVVSLLDLAELGLAW